MSASTLTAFLPIPEGSEATPGLFNSRFQRLQDNIVSVNSVVLNPSVLSGSTWASIGLFANSSGSDYLRLVDSANQRSTYRIGSNAGGTADGLNIFDESGNTMIVSFSKQSIRFYQTVVGPVFDVGGALTSTVNAGVYGTASDSAETRIQAAINAASFQGAQRVYVPANMYPYSASSISFINTIHMVREGGDWVNFDLQAYGANPNGLVNCDASLVAARNAAGNTGSIYIPIGTHLFSTWTFDNASASIKGASRDGSILKTTQAANIGLNFASVVLVEGIDMENLTLSGNSINLGGISLGNSATTYGAFVRMNNVVVSGFSKTGGYGLSLNAVQELAIEDCKIFRNYNNIYRPNQGFCTSAVVRGQKGFVGNATNRGVSLEGTCADISFLEQVFESNAQEAIYASGFASVVAIQDCYFEANLASGVSTQGTVHLSGAAGASNSLKGNVRRNHFHIVDAANSLAKQLKLDYVKGTVVAENSGLLNSSGITTTANTQAHFQDNADTDSSDFLSWYRTLLGAITASEIDPNGRRFEFGNRRLDDVHFNSSQQTAPTIAVQSQAGTGATAVLDASATDIKGEITVVTGSGAWSAGPLALLTFQRAYSAVPQVQISPRNNNAGAAWANNGTFTNYVDATGFYLQFASAATVSKTYIWSYQVIQ